MKSFVQLQSETHAVQLDFLLTDIGAANTFLDVANTTRDAATRARNIGHATEAHDVVRRMSERAHLSAAEHMCDHAVALAAALPSLLSDAEAAVPPPAPRRPAVPVASPFAVTRTPAGLQSPPAVPASKGAGSDDMPSSARRSSIASHVGHAQLLPSFDSEAGSAALGGGVHGVGSVELPTQDSQQLSGFDRIDSVRMPSFGDHFRTDRLDSMRMPSFRDNFRTVRAGVAQLHGPLPAQRAGVQQPLAAVGGSGRCAVAPALLHAAAAPCRSS